MRAVRFLILWFIAIFALTAGISGARAQTYDFTFNCGAGCGITGGVIQVVSGSVTSISGTATGLSGVQLNGAFAFNSSLDSFIGSYTSSSDYSFAVATNNAGNPYIQLDIISGMINNPSDVFYAVSGSPNAEITGTSTVTPETTATPAPEAGTGFLSFLMLGLAALWHKRRSIVMFVRERRLVGAGAN